MNRQEPSGPRRSASVAPRLQATDGRTPMHDSTRRTLIRAVAAGGALSVLSGTAPAQQGVLHVIAELVSKPDTAGQLRDMLVPFAASSAEEPGCLEYTLMEVEDEPGRFLTYERWTDHAALEAHMNTPTIQAIVPKLGDVLARPFTQIFLGAPSTT